LTKNCMHFFTSPMHTTCPPTSSHFIWAMRACTHAHTKLILKMVKNNSNSEISLYSTYLKIYLYLPVSIIFVIKVLLDNIMEFMIPKNQTLHFLVTFKLLADVLQHVTTQISQFMSIWFMSYHHHTNLSSVVTILLTPPPQIHNKGWSLV
jgi:hypothetical protein